MSRCEPIRESAPPAISSPITGSDAFRLALHPANVAPSARARTRSGCRSASSSAIIPPIEIPKTNAGPAPAASSTAAASSARSPIPNGRSGAVDSPAPRLSKTTTRNSLASRSGMGPHARAEKLIPMTRSSGGASSRPSVSYERRWVPRSAKGMGLLRSLRPPSSRQAAPPA